MPAHRGQAWGNALGGYKYQRRAKGGKFAKGKVQGFQKAMAKGKDKKAGITSWEAAGIGVGAALITGAVVGGGIYAYKSGLHKGLIKAPTISMKSADASIKASAKIAGATAAKNVANAATAGTSFNVARKSLENASSSLMGAGKSAVAFATSDKTANVFETIQSAAKTTAAVSGAAVAASGAAAVVKATAGGLAASANDRNLVDAPKKKRTPRAPKPAVIPAPGSKNVTHVSSAAPITKEVVKGAPKEKGQSNVEPTAIADVFGRKVPGIEFKIDGRKSKKSVIAIKRPKDYSKVTLSPAELEAHKAKRSLAVSKTPNRSNERVSETISTTSASTSTKGKKKRAYTDANGIYHPSGFGSVDDD